MKAGHERRESLLTIEPYALLRELALRGWTAADLARAAEVSPTTITAIVQGHHRVAPRVVRRIGIALRDQPVIATIAALLGEAA
jgi:transcriptional regulator with XRE-family HTH domain